MRVVLLARYYFDILMWHLSGIAMYIFLPALIAISLSDSSRVDVGFNVLIFLLGVFACYRVCRAINLIMQKFKP